jgi:hypothetical protein
MAHVSSDALCSNLVPARRRLLRGRLGPFCECGNCDATGRSGDPEIRLPRAAWAVAGHGELNALAVHPDHIEPFLNDYVVTVYPAGWAAVRSPRLSSLGPPRP